MQRTEQDITARKRRHLLQQRRQAVLKRQAAATKLAHQSVGLSTKTKRVSTNQQPTSIACAVTSSAATRPSTRQMRPIRGSEPRRSRQTSRSKPTQAQVSASRLTPTARGIASSGYLQPRPSSTKPRPASRHPLSRTQAPQRIKKHKTRRPPHRPLLYLSRLLVGGVGVGFIAGTLLTLLEPAPQPTSSRGDRLPVARSALQPQTDSTARTATVSATAIPLAAADHPQQMALEQLKSKIETLAAAQPQLTAGLYFYSPETGTYLDIAGGESFSAASTIKVPVLLAFFQAVDANEIQLDEQLVMRPDLIATEAGVMQYQPPGTKFTARETAEKMITISDNTATNMLIDRLGGVDRLNRRFLAWGLTHTKIRNPLPDLEGTNTISPRDLSLLMLKLGEGKLLSMRSRDLALDILRRTVTKTLLPQGLGPGATIAHKTGDIGSSVGDTGFIEMPNGRRYVATVMVERPHNDPRAQALIRTISKLTYQVFNQPIAPPQQQTSSPE